MKQGAQKIVIDVRDTAGGSLNEAVAVANLFIKDGVIAADSRSRRQSR